MDILAPFGSSAGISRIQWELEDLAFRYLEPRNTEELLWWLCNEEEREAIIRQAILDLEYLLQHEGIAADISGRPKHFYSIYHKMERGRTFDEIYDLTAIQ